MAHTLDTDVSSSIRIQDMRNTGARKMLFVISQSSVVKAYQENVCQTQLRNKHKLTCDYSNTINNKHQIGDVKVCKHPMIFISVCQASDTLTKAGGIICTTQEDHKQKKRLSTFSCMTEQRPRVLRRRTGTQKTLLCTCPAGCLQACNFLSVGINYFGLRQG